MNNFNQKLKVAVVALLAVMNFSLSVSALENSPAKTNEKASSLNDAIKSHIVKCLAKDAKECSKAAVLFQNGIGVTQSNSQALAYFDKACSLNSGTDCMRLANRYVVGDGVELNSKTAFHIIKSLQCQCIRSLQKLGLYVRTWRWYRAEFRKSCCDVSVFLQS